ncbi:MAG: hypothetical protein ACOYW3_13340, partial [Bacteroidota bacterium]
MRVVYVLLFTIVFLPLAAQDGETVSVRLENAKFETLVEELERQSSFRFFYKSEWTDSLAVTVTATNSRITRVLEQVFEGTTLQ